MYQLIDSGNFLKLEQVGPFRLVRPAASATWEPQLSSLEWSKYDALFERHEDDGRSTGEWKIKNSEIKNPWLISVADIQFKVKLTSFGHLGIFPEQKENWLEMRDLIKSKIAKDKRTFKVLNLFAYTGGSTLFCSQAGAEVVHLDASKTSVTWARENATESKLDKNPIRWIVDDVSQFVTKEVRRGSKYQGIILDPPSYGRGPDKQMWKIEDHLMPLLKNLQKLMADDFSFILLSCHSQGYTPVSLKNQLEQLCSAYKGNYDSAEMLVVDKQNRPLPAGCSCLFSALD